LISKAYFFRIYFLVFYHYNNIMSLLSGVLEFRHAIGVRVAREASLDGGDSGLTDVGRSVEIRLANAEKADGRPNAPASRQVSGVPSDRTAPVAMEVDDG